MQTPAQASSANTPQPNDYITIVAPTIDEVMCQFRRSGLAEKGYSIAGQVARHRFAYAGGSVSEDLFGGVRMIAATFMRAATT